MPRGMLVPLVRQTHFLNVENLPSSLILRGEGRIENLFQNAPCMVYIYLYIYTISHKVKPNDR